MAGNLVAHFIRCAESRGSLSSGMSDAQRALMADYCDDEVRAQRDSTFEVTDYEKQDLIGKVKESPCRRFKT